MGKVHAPIDNDSSLAFGVLWPVADSSGQGNRATIMRGGGSASQTPPSGERNPKRASNGQELNDALAQKAKIAAFQAVFRSVENLRTAALDCHKTVKAADEAGLGLSEIVHALRADNLDWDKEFQRVQTTALLLDAVGATTVFDLMILTDDPVAHPKELLKNIEANGYMAGIIGRHPEFCDHPKGTDEYDYWMIGYRRAKADLKG